MEEKRWWRQRLDIQWVKAHASSEREVWYRRRMQRGYQKQVTSYFATQCSTINNCTEWNGRYCTTAVQATNRDRVKWVHIRQHAHYEGDRQTTDIHETLKWGNAAHKKMDTIEERLGITRNRTPTRVSVPTKQQRLVQQRIARTNQTR